MNFHNEIGGYFQLELREFTSTRNDVILLNSARSALRCIVRNYHVKEIQVPYYTCPVIWQALLAENCKLLPYDIDDNFSPISINPELPVIYTNYFGINSNIVNSLTKVCKYLILDNAQAFFAKPEGIGCIWSPRKFFGLPDGGILWPKISGLNLKESQSWHRCSHLLKRVDLGASNGYSDFKINDSSLDKEEPCYMSKLTEFLMNGIDINYVKEKRVQNFTYLDKMIGSINGIKIAYDPTNDVPMVYPLRTKNRTLREILIKNKIYVAKYWPKNDGMDCMTSYKSMKMAEEIIPLPIDQRYDDEDMEIISEIILRNL